MSSSSLSSAKLSDAERSPVIVVGIGSPYGDDQAGWCVVDQLAQLGFSSCITRKANVPHDIFDWLDSETPLHLVDACFDASASVRRWEVVFDCLGALRLRANLEAGVTGRDAFQFLRSSSTHQFDLLSTLELAAVLGKLPKQVVLWTIPVSEPSLGKQVGMSTRTLIAECAAQIDQELQHA